MEKQIEEMARDICGNFMPSGNCHKDDMPCDLECVYGVCAQRLYNKDYRKRSDTAKEIFAAVDKIINKHHSECYEYEDGDECDTAITYLSYVSADIDELKKKYLEANDAESN